MTTTSTDRDPLWPAGNRPLCRTAGCTKHVYMAGLCGRHWANPDAPLLTADDFAPLRAAAQVAVSALAALDGELRRAGDRDATSVVTTYNDQHLADLELQRQHLRDLLRDLTA